MEGSPQAFPAPPGMRLSVPVLIALAVQTAVPPFATDMYTPAFPEVTAGLRTQASLVGLTLTLFFLGFGAGQLLGGPISDRAGRRVPMLVGGLLCTLGALGCALAPNIGVLILMRLVQGAGGGVAATVARAVVVDVARGDALARMISIMMAMSGLAPAVAPVVGGAILTIGAGWRDVFWVLTLFGAVMTLLAVLFVQESLPAERRSSGGLATLFSGVPRVLRIRAFVGYMLIAALSGFAMFAYISNASYAIQVINGVAPLPYSLFFAGTALTQVGLTLLNARLLSRFRPRRLIGAGLAGTGVATVLLVASVAFFGTALVPTCAGFLLLMSSQSFVFGNASALALAEARHLAGAASGVQGVTQSVSFALSAPLATAGGGVTAVPMVIVMAVGVGSATVAFLFSRRIPPAAASLRD